MARWWALILVTVTATTATAAPLDKPAFTATPGELLAAAKTAPIGDWPAVILRYDIKAQFDAAGRRSFAKRSVYVIRSREGVDQWSELQQLWRPFFQDKPTVRLRVIAPNKAVTKLDPSTLTDEAVAATGDRRRMTIPVPPLAIGSVVEVEISVRDRQPMLGSHNSVLFELGDTVPTLAMRAVFTAPVARKLQLRTRNLPTGVTPRHEVTGTTESWTYETAVPATPAREAHAPGDHTTSVTIAASTSGSWSELARDLSAAIDKQIAAGPVALPAELPTTPTIDTARAITAWVHRKVKYSGIGLRDSVLLPSTPAATLKRGTGSDNDLAALVVGLLRQTKIRADLVLLSLGPGEDIDPSSPSLGEFDHVVVRARINNADVWIDVPEALAQVGTLATVDQGRKALVIAGDSAGLVDTPRSRSTDNTIREVRTFDIAEQRGSQITAVTRTTGELETEYRRWARDSEDFKKEMLDELDSRFLTKELERHTVTPPDDLTKPFEITIVGKQAQRAVADREQLKAYLFPGVVLGRAAELFDESPRQRDFVWQTPYVYEIETRLIIPDGFALPKPNPDRVRKLGTMTFTHRERLDGRTYVVTFKLDSGKPRLTPAEYLATAKAIAETKDERIDIVLDLTAVELERDGKVKEAIAELERLIKLHPKEAIHHSQLVPIYMRAGMGQAARREARKAVQLAPTDADTYVVLGWALRHDSVGREFGYDHDRAGALAAYAKARKLEPTHYGAIVDYATMLEVGPTGRRYDAAADLRGAVVQWRAAELADDTHPRADDLVRALIYTEQFKEAEEVALAAPVTEDRDSLLIAAIAGGPGGVPAAIAKAGTLRKGKEVDDLIEAAAGVLFATRAYAPARGLYGHIGKLVSSSYADIVTKVQRVDLKPDRGDPRTAFREVILALADDAGPTDAIWNDDLVRQIRRDNASTAATLTTHTDAVLADVARVLDLRIEGGVNGPWRLAQTFLATQPMYVIRDRGIAKLVGWGTHVAPIGEAVIRELGRNNQAAAFQLLDWLHQDLGTKAGAGRLIAAAWGNTRTKEAALLAGALISSTRFDAAIPILRDCKTPDAALKKGCRYMLAAHLLRANQLKALEDHARSWVAAEPTDDDAAETLVRTLIVNKKLAEAHKLIDARLATDPTEDLALHLRAQAFTFDNKLADAIKIYDTTSWGRDVGKDLNEAAWLRLVAGRELDRALAGARKASETTTTDDEVGTRVHTLAAIQAELADISGSNASIQRSMTARLRQRPEASDWYVYGRMAEQLGLVPDAIDAYRRVTPVPNQPPIGTYHLAQRRLKTLRP